MNGCHPTPETPRGNDNRDANHAALRAEQPFCRVDPGLALPPARKFLLRHVSDKHSSPPQPSQKNHCEVASGTALTAGHYDIALAARQGRGLEARVLRGKDPFCKWTHLGLAFARPGSQQWRVLHADPGQGHNGRVREDSFTEFADQALSACLMDLPVEDVRTATALRTEALRYVGVPFDGRYDWTRSDAVYCTSLLWRILSIVGIPVPQPPFPSFVLPLLGARELILPSLFIQHTGDLWL